MEGASDDYLTEAELKQLHSYKHVAPKTTFEKFYVEKFLVPVEKYAFPKSWSANTITLVGQAPMFFYYIYLWFSQNATMLDPIPDSCFIWMAFVLQWFSLNDCMDGMRARRTRCGSPLGRIIDEAIDQIAYACIGGFVGYLLRVEPGLWLFSIGLVNLPFYAMEIRHIYCKQFLMIVGELGPVEVELIYSLIFLLTGTVWGGACFEKSLSELTGVENAYLAAIKLKYSVAVLTFFLVILFAYDNVKDSLNINPKETLRLFVPVFAIVAISFLSAYLPSAHEETVVAYFLYQGVFAIVILKLMLFNMAGKPMHALHLQFVYLLIPIVAYFMLGVSPRTEIMLTRSCMVLSLLEFFYIIYRVSRQYTRRHNLSFFTIKEKQ
jgi:phosphatidylglycerophosphate synthase